MKKYVGEIIIATAILHTIVGLILGYQPLLAIAQSGFFNSVDPHFDRMAIVWFLMFGVLLFLIGSLIRWIQPQIDGLPNWLAWFLWLLAISGVILMPISGFWILFPIGWLVYQQSMPRVKSL